MTIDPEVYRLADRRIKTYVDYGNILLRKVENTLDLINLTIILDGLGGLSKICNQKIDLLDNPIIGDILRLEYNGSDLVRANLSLRDCCRDIMAKRYFTKMVELGEKLRIPFPEED